MLQNQADLALTPADYFRRLAAGFGAFVLIFAILILLHLPLLRLPYYWDEAGYYIPAARDFLLSGSLIPHSTPSNAHPPLVMAILALSWKLAGYSVLVTRFTMLAIASFSLIGILRLAKSVSNLEIAIATSICTALYPVFFAQSSLAHVDLAAAGLTFWGLEAYLGDRRLSSALWFCLAVMAKETAILAPMAILGWEVLSAFFSSRWRSTLRLGPERRGISFVLFLPLLLLCCWYAYHYHQTGFIFGNPEFFRYNVQTTLRPLRMLLALGLRLWQTFGYLNLYLLTVLTVIAMSLPAQSDDGVERRRISIPVQMVFLAVILAYVVVMAVIGGAVLARYMLPVVPLVILVGVATLRRRIRSWKPLTALIAAALTAAIFINPPHGFPMEDNLAYRDYIVLHQRAEQFLSERYPHSRVLTAWPANDELTRPYLGYVARPMQVLSIEDFSAEQITAAADLRRRFDLALLFSTKYEPPHPLLENWRRWQDWKREFFGYHQDLPPMVAAQMLGGRIVYAETRHGQWIAVVEPEDIQEAQHRPAPTHLPAQLASKWHE